MENKKEINDEEKKSDDKNKNNEIEGKNKIKEKSETKNNLFKNFLHFNNNKNQKQDINIDKNNKNEDKEKINPDKNEIYSQNNNTNETNEKNIKEEAKENNINEENKEDKNEIITKSDEYTNITEDGGVKKRILKEGHGAKPKEGNEVAINYVGKYNDDIIDHSNENEPLCFTVGENKVAKIWEITVKTMSLGEKSEFIMTPEYTSDITNNNENIPKEAVLTYQIELKSIHYKSTEESLENLTYEEKLQWGKLLKQNGVEKFKDNDIQEAKKCFLNALTFLKSMNPEKEEEKEGVDLLLTILANICNCFNKEKDYDSVLKFAFIGVNIKPTTKLLYFRTIAFANLEDFENAENGLKDLIALFASNGQENTQEVNDTINYLKELIDSRKKIFEEKNKKFSRAIYRQVFFNNKNMKEKILVPGIDPNPLNPFVFFEIQIENDNIGKIEFELFKDVVPITVENFRNLCIEAQEGLTYKNSCINKIIKDFVIGGGILKNSNEEKKCIYGKYFDDENYTYCHCRRGLLTMDNDGKNKNNSKFLITLKHIPWFDGKHVVFGQVIKGMEIIKQIEDIETDNDDKPLKRITIINCGEIINKEKEENKEINENKIEDNKENKNIINEIKEGEYQKKEENNLKIEQNELNITEEDKKDINELKNENLNNEKEINKSEENKKFEENKIEKNEDENLLVNNKENIK